MKLSIVIPVYNEEKTIHTVIDKLFRVKFNCKTELIIVNDGSTDKTKEEIDKIVQKKTTLIKKTHKTNRGKGAAIRTGIAYCSGDFVFFHDADLEYNPSDIPKLLARIPKKEEKVAVYGSRFLKNSVSIPFLYLIGNIFLTFLTNVLYSTKLTDMETGYKLLPLSFLKKIRLTNNRFDIEPEITIKLIKQNIPIYEVPISYKSRTHLAGKKLTIRDAIGAIRTLLYYRFSP